MYNVIIRNIIFINSLTQCYFIDISLPAILFITFESSQKTIEGNLMLAALTSSTINKKLFCWLLPQYQPKSKHFIYY